MLGLSETKSHLHLEEKTSAVITNVRWANYNNRSLYRTLYRSQRKRRKIWGDENQFKGL